jgi:hypothetical protein
MSFERLLARAEVIPKLIAVWKGDPAYLQEYIRLIEASKEKKALTKRLLEIRSATRPEETLIARSLEPKKIHR